MAPRLFAEAETMVFWDVEECRIPTTDNPVSIYANIKSALQNEGYTGKMNICAYSDTKQKAEQFEEAGIKLVPTGDKKNRYNVILKDIYRWMSANPPFLNVMLICPDISYDREYVDAVVFLEMHGYNVLLSHHKDVSGVLAATVLTVWLWKYLLAGRKPIPRIRSSSLILGKNPDKGKGKGKGKGKD